MCLNGHMPPVEGWVGKEGEKEQLKYVKHGNNNPSARGVSGDITYDFNLK